MFEELFPQRRPAPYHDDAISAGFEFIADTANFAPEVAELKSVHGEICNCAIGSYRGRRVAVFENFQEASQHRSWVVVTLAYDIGEHDFREVAGLASYWNIRHEGHWVYFEWQGSDQTFPNFQDFLRDTNEILEMYLL